MVKFVHAHSDPQNSFRPMLTHVRNLLTQAKNVLTHAKIFKLMRPTQVFDPRHQCTPVLIYQRDPRNPRNLADSKN